MRDGFKTLAKPGKLRHGDHVRHRPLDRFRCFRLKCGTGRSDRTVSADEDRPSASQCRCPCCFGIRPCPWWRQIARTHAPSLCRRPFRAIVVLLLVMTSLLKIVGGSALERWFGDECSQLLADGCGDICVSWQHPFILARAWRLAWAFVRQHADRLPCTCTHQLSGTLPTRFSLILSIFRRLLSVCLSIYLSIYYLCIYIYMHMYNNWSTLIHIYIYTHIYWCSAYRPYNYPLCTLQ